jgi:hypothetical protein
MVCTFSPAGTFIPYRPGALVPSPTQQGAAVVSTASRVCVSDCEVDDIYATNKPAFLPLSPGQSFDVACFVDLNGSDARDPGDLVSLQQLSTALLLTWPTLNLGVMQ